MRLTKQQILAAQDSTTELVKVDEWVKDGEIAVRSLNLEEADKWRRTLMVKTSVRQRNGTMTSELVFDTDNAQKNEVNLIITAAVDDDGKQLFTAEDLAPLMTKSLVPIKRIVLAIMRISGLSEAEKEEDLANAVKN